MDDTLYKSLINSTQALENMSGLLSNVTSEIENLTEVIKGLGEYSISDAFGDIANMLTIADGFKQIGSGLLKIVSDGGTAATVLGTLGSVLSSISPLLIFAVAIGGIVSIIGSLVKGTDEASDKTDKYVEKLNSKREAIQANTEEMKKNSDAMINNANAIQNDYSFTLSQVDELVNLTGEGGYATNLEKAKYLVDQINGVLPNSVSITKDGKIAWQDNTKAAAENGEVIKAGIKELERRALAESFQKEATEAIRNRTKYEAELTAAQRDRKKAQTDVTIAENLYQEELENYGPNVEKYQKALEEAEKKLKAQNGVLYDAQEQFAQNEKSINMCSYAYEGLDGNIESSAKLQAEMYTEMGNRGTSTWKSIGAAIVDLDLKQQEHLEKGLDASSQEVQLNTRTAELINEQCFAKAAAYGYSFEKMVSTLEEEGVKLNGRELELLEEQFNNYNQNLKNKEELQKLGFENMFINLEENGLVFNEKDQEILNQELVNWAGNAKSKEDIQALNSETLIANLESAGIVLNDTQKALLTANCDDWKAKAIEKEEVYKGSIKTIIDNLSGGLSTMNADSSAKASELINVLKNGGIEGGAELCQELATSLTNNGGKVTDETLGIIDQILGLVDSTNPELQVVAKGPSKGEIEGIAPNTQQYMGNLNLPIGIYAMSSGIQLAGHFYDLIVRPRADGGFPDTGELFVAREAGPELVGRINGKTAVANNDQIVSGISSGVYNAMIGAMSRSNRTNTMVTAIFQVDGKQVAKQVINAHNKEVIQTGRSPLLI